MDKLELALEIIDGQRFEDFAIAFLREEGYEVHESGGSDSRWNALSNSVSGTESPM